MPHEPRFQSLDTRNFDDGTIPVFNADVGAFQPAGGLDGTTLRVAQLLTNDGAPANNTGFDGDFYLDQISGAYYRKQSGSWLQKGNLKGAPGGPGDKGPTGDRGLQGDKGLIGDKGPIGDKGTLGDIGPQGSIGDKGPLGDKGPVGDKGALGDKGPTGDKGLMGDTGPTGDRGPQGSTGDKGPLGDKGPQGDAGLSGIPSNDANLVHKDDYLATLSNFGTFTGYQRELHNWLFQADKRFGVTSSGFLFGSPSNLFNGVFAESSAVDVGQTGVITIDIRARGEYGLAGTDNGITYLGGFLFVYFYYNQYPASVSARIQTKDGVWHNCPPGQEIGVGDTRMWKIPTSRPGLENYGQKFEISIVASSERQAWLNEIEGCLLSPTTAERLSQLDRNSSQSIYFPWSWRNTSNEKTVEIDPQNGTVKASNLLMVGDYFSYDNLLVGKRVFDSNLANYFWQAYNRFSITSIDAITNNNVYIATQTLFSRNNPSGTPVGTMNPIKMTMDFTAKGDTTGFAYYDGLLFFYFYAFKPLGVQVYLNLANGNKLGPYAASSVSGSDYFYKCEVFNLGDYLVGMEFIFTPDPAINTIWLAGIEYFLTSSKGQQTSGIRRDHPLDSFYPVQTRDSNNAITAQLNTSGQHYAKRDYVCDDPNFGTVLRSPNGHYWRQTISDAGTLTWTDLGTVAPV